MIDKKHAGSEIGRMVGLDYFPTNHTAIQELVTVLRMSETETIATAVVNDWMETQSERPTPADLRRLVASHNEARKERLRQESEAIPDNYRCSQCCDSGVVGGVMGGKGRDGEPAEWCGCPATVNAKKERKTLRDGRVVDLVTAYNWAIEVLRKLPIRPVPEKRRSKTNDPFRNVEDVYFGEF